MRVIHPVSASEPPEPAVRQIPLLFFLKKIYLVLFYVHVYYTYMYVCIPSACLVPIESRRGYSILRTEFQMVASIHALIEIELVSSEGAVSVPNHLAISSSYKHLFFVNTALPQVFPYNSNKSDISRDPDFKKVLFFMISVACCFSSIIYSVIHLPWIFMSCPDKRNHLTSTSDMLCFHK